MEYKEQQEQELEALESIFPLEFELIKKEPFGSFKFTLRTKNYERTPSEAAILVVTFTYTEKYPDEGPEVTINDCQNCVVDTVMSYIEDTANENLGMPMIYTIIVGITDKMEIDNEQRMKDEAERKLNIERQKELEEIKKFEGTKVTVENFLKWKEKFDKEMLELKRREADTGTKKPSGKQLFEKHLTQDDSDLQFINDGDDNVEIDESLFQELEGIDIEDDIELEDDEE